MVAHDLGERNHKSFHFGKINDYQSLDVASSRVLTSKPPRNLSSLTLTLVFGPEWLVGFPDFGGHTFGSLYSSLTQGCCR